MSFDRRTGPDHGCGDDVAAYALGALDPADAERFRAHLETCSICRDELATFEDVVHALPLSVQRHRAPAGLRRDLMRTVQADARAASRAARPAPTRTRPAWLPAWLSLRPAIGLATAAIVAIAVVIGVSSGGSGPATRVIHAQVTGHGYAELRVSGGRAELVVNGLPAPAAGRIYEVWLQRPGGSPTPTRALFSVNSAGQGDVDVPGSLHGVAHVMVTSEPAGGSLHPTRAPVINASLA